MNRFIEVIIEFPISSMFIVTIAISMTSMIFESIKKRKNRK
jgi:hypothetical protein